jgi:acetyl-CoA acetyltransferase
MSQQGDLSHRSTESVFWECVKGALADAGLTLGDVDGLVGSLPDGPGLRAALPASAFADQLGHQLRFHTATVNGAASVVTGGIGHAAMAIAHGHADVVVVPTAIAGTGLGFGTANRDAAVERMAKVGSPFEYLWGTTRVADYAVIAQRYMHEYGTTQEQLAAVAVAARTGATLNPLSTMGSRGTITIADVMSSRMIADPLKLLDCSIINQGGGCIVLTSLDSAAAGSSHHPVVLRGWGECHTYLDPHVADLTTFGGRTAADAAFAAAGVRRDEISVAAFADYFTINVPIELEDAGFCDRGDGGAFVASGALEIGGQLPTNTGGGYLSCSRAGACSLLSIIELVVQLRHEAGPRQVANATLAYSHAISGVMQAHYTSILGRR